MARSRRRRRGRSRESPAKRWLARSALAAVVLVVLGMLGGYVWLQRFLRSEKFLTMVNTRLSETLEADARFSGFEWDGMQMGAPQFEVDGEKLFRRIEMEGFETEIKFGPLLRRKVETRDIRVRRLHVDVDLTKDAPVFDSGKDSSFTFGSLGIDDLSGAVDFGDSQIRWEGVTASLTPGHTQGTYDATLRRGSLTTPLSLFPEPRLQEANIRYADEALFVTDGRWKVYHSGRLKTNGEVDFSNGEYAFKGQLTGVRCEEMLPDDWKKKLRGELSSQFRVEGEGKGPPVVKGDLDLIGGSLTALPVLDRIAAYADTERFRRLNLRRARMDFRQEGEILELTDVVIASEGLLRIEGRLMVEAGRLDGLFNLGVTPGTLAGIPGAETKVFHPGENGMLWTPVRISGTVGLPKEDLSERLIAAAGERMFEMVPETGQLVLRHSGRAAGDVAKGILKTTGDAAAAGLDIIDQGTSILRNGITPEGVDPIRGVGSVFDSLLGNGDRKSDPVRPDPQPKSPDGVVREGEKKLEEKGEELEEDAKKSAEEELRREDDREKDESLLEKAGKLIGRELDPASR